MTILETKRIEPTPGLSGEGKAKRRGSLRMSRRIFFSKKWEMSVMIFNKFLGTFAQVVHVDEQVDDDAGVEHQSHGRMILCPSL